MRSLKKIGDRIQSVKATQQITSSMKIVALAQLKKIHALFLKMIPYAEEMNRIIRRLIRSATKRQEDLDWQNLEVVLPLPPLLKGNGQDKRHVVIVITADDGLSGTANLNVVQQARRVIDYLRKQDKSVYIFAFGTRGADILKRFYPNEEMTVLKRKTSRDGNPYLDAERLASRIIDSFYGNRFDVCLVVYNQFKSIVSQKPTIEQLIPNKLFALENPWSFLVNDDSDYIHRDALGKRKIKLKSSPFLKAIGGADVLSSLGALDDGILKAGKRLPEAYDYEPSDIGMLDMILPQYMIAYIYRALWEADVSDNAARLMAMDNATRNAEDILQDLTKKYRRLRQSKITTDLAETFFDTEIKGEDNGG